MKKRFFPLSISILCLLVILAGCDIDNSPSSSEEWIGSDLIPSSPDIITFQLPDINPNVAKYRVKLVAPVTFKNLGVQEGLPGETLTFDLNHRFVYVNMKLTAYDANGDVLSRTPVTVIDLDIHGTDCDIVAESSSAMTGTDVNFYVDCFGINYEIDYDGGLK